jgi:hypothetical protein
MRFAQAKKLHNEDEVTDKATGAVVRVLKTKVIDDGTLKRPTVFIETSDSLGLWHEYMHTEVS